MNDQELLELPVDELQRQVDVLNAKMDRVLEELEYERHQRMAREDLEADLMRVGNDVYKTAMSGLEEYADTVNGKELQQLVWNLARNLQSINKVVLQMESGMTFLEDSSPIIRQIIIDLTARLDEWDRRGYFTVLRSGSDELARVLRTVDDKEIHAAGRKLATVLENLRGTDWSQVDRKKTGFMHLFRELRTPEVKRGVALLLLVLKAVAGHKEFDEEITTQENAISKE